jgi:small subunit ribosomal protein S4
MGKPKFSRKKYETPNHPWKEERISAENELIQKYGLKNKREIWKAETTLRKYRGQARELLAGSEDPQVKKETNQLIQHLTRLNILLLNSTLDDVLALDTEAILARRLQTLAYLKGFANTPKHARQLISHGHIAIGDRRITVPSYRVTKGEESKIGYTADSALNDMSHPARPSSDFKSKITQKLEEAEEKKQGGKPVEKQQKPKQKPAAEKKDKPKKKEKPTPVSDEKQKEKPAEKPKVKQKPADQKKAEEKPAAPQKEEKKPQDKPDQKKEKNQEKTADEKKPAEKGGNE